MFGDTNDNTNSQQPGDNTPPPMLDTPVNTDSPASDPVSTDSTPEPADPPASDEQFTPSQDNSTPVPTSEPASASVDADPAPADDKSDDMGVSAPSSNASPNDLLNIKQQALEHLTPLVDHLDQSPKEEFRTTMMMIQATDNQDLIKKAFEAAQKIDDDKERAQAFLDIINEINYFTQSHEQ